MSQSPESATPTPTASPAQVPFTAQKEYEPCQECGAPLDAPAALLRQLRGAAGERGQPRLALFRGRQQAGSTA